MGHCRHASNLLIIALEPVTALILHRGYVVTIALRAKVMNNAVQCIVTSDVLLTAGDLHPLLQLHDIVYLSKIHVFFTKNETLEMDYEHLWQ